MAIASGEATKRVHSDDAHVTDVKPAENRKANMRQKGINMMENDDKNKTIGNEVENIFIA